MALTAKIIHAMANALQENRLREREHARRDWFADIPANTMLDDILKPAYWKHHVRVLRPMDRIEAFCEDGSWEADLRVMFVGQAEVKVAVIHKVSYHETVDEMPLSDSYDVKWKGPAAKFAVVNKATGELIKDRLYPRDAAISYLRQHLVTMK